MFHTLHSIRPAAIAAAVVTVSCMLGTGAFADSNLNCDAYAGAAVAENQQNIAQNCGFTGPGWQSDFNAHRAWCLSPAVHMADLTTEDQARQTALAQCANKAAADQQACTSYAELAVWAAQQSIANNCGFSGSGWQQDFGAHFSWCLGAAQAARDVEANARKNQLIGCLSAKP